jgi:hypothetical protein
LNATDKELGLTIGNTIPLISDCDTIRKSLEKISTLKASVIEKIDAHDFDISKIRKTLDRS